VKLLRNSRALSFGDVSFREPRWRWTISEWSFSFVSNLHRRSAVSHRSLALLVSALLMLACDSGANPDPRAPHDLEPTTPGAACLVPDAERLDFGTVLSGTFVTREARFASCDSAAVEVVAVDVPDDGDMLLAVRVVHAGLERTTLFPFVLDPDDELLVRVTYRARASAADEPVLRHLRVAAESRATPELPGHATVALAAQPRSACPDDTCGAPGPTWDRWRLRSQGDGNPGPPANPDREQDYWEQRR
jgi:hypothetical protein